MKRFFPAFLLLAVAAAQTISGASFVNAQTTSPSCLVLTASLSVGSTDAATNGSVTLLQNFLYGGGFFTANSTGYFGPLTSAAVSKFQSSVGLPTVGVVGPLTRAAIQKASCAPVLSSPPAPVATSTPSTDTSAPSTATSTPASSTTIGQEPESIGPEPLFDMSATTTGSSTSDDSGAGSTTLAVDTPAATSTATTTSITVTASTTAATLPYKAQSFSDWQPVWGQVNIGTTSTSDTLSLVGSLSNNGAEAVYPASEGWTDYRYTANVSVANGNVSLIARYVDSNDYLACNFSSNWVELDQVYNGTQTVLISKAVDGILSTENAGTQTTSMAMDVQGNTVGCAGFGPNDNITYTLPAGSPMQGGIGIESWYSVPLADQLNLLNVEVDPL